MAPSCRQLGRGVGSLGRPRAQPAEGREGVEVAKAARAPAERGTAHGSPAARGSPHSSPPPRRCRAPGAPGRGERAPGSRAPWPPPRAVPGRRLVAGLNGAELPSSPHRQPPWGDRGFSNASARLGPEGPASSGRRRPLGPRVGRAEPRSLSAGCALCLRPVPAPCPRSRLGRAGPSFVARARARIPRFLHFFLKNVRKSRGWIKNVTNVLI